MGGLECSEILLSCLERTLRIDSEFYKKENLSIEAELKKTNFHPLTDFFTVSDGNHMSISENFQMEGVPYYRGQDIYNVFIEESDPTCIDEKTYEHPHMQRSHLREGDVLMSIVGAIVGNSAIVSSNKKATCSCKLSIMRTKHNGVLPEVLLIYIKTKYGQNQIQKFKRGAAQTGLLLEDFDQLYIPLFGDRVQEAIYSVVKTAHKLTIAANKAYFDADKILFDSIENHKGKKNRIINISERLFTNSFAVTGRLDAEYYQEKYDEYQFMIENYKNGYSTIAREFIPVKKKCVKVLAEYPYVEIGDVNIKTGSATYSLINTEDLPDNAKIMTCKGDIIVSTVRPNRGAVAILHEDGLLVSGAFTVLRECTTYKKEVLQVLLRSSLYRDWFLRYNVGTSYPVIKDNDVLNMPIPLLESEMQEIIATKVKESIAFYQSSKQLLEFARQTVEMAIEQSEDEALDWLKDKEGYAYANREKI